MRQGVEPSEIVVIAQAHLRYAGTDSALPIPIASLRGMRALFEIAHQKRFGFISPEKDIEIEAIEVEGRGGGEPIVEPELAVQEAAPPPEPHSMTRLFTGGAWHAAPVFLRAGLAPGHRIAGPALIIEDHQTVAVEPEWEAQVTSRNHLLLARIAKRQEARVGKRADPVMLEVFNNLFVSIAEQMGYALQNTARSVNIKERLDFSCAIFDARGRLIANAPHIPVHLGSMDKSVETVLREIGEALKPGDSYMLNAPYNGGTHLPDITVVTPVFGENSPDLLFFVAARGPPRRYRRHRARLDEPQSDAHRGGRRLYRPVQAGGARPLPRGRGAGAADECPLPRAEPGAERRRPQGPGRRQREGRGRARAKWCGITGCRRCAPIWAMCRTTPPKPSRASSPS